MTMRTYQDMIGVGSGRGWSETILSGMAACALTALPALAAGDTPGSAGGPGEQGPFASGGDETLGTLPIVDSGKGTLDYLRFLRSVRPAFVLEGALDDLHNAILLAQGTGAIGVEIVDPVTGRARLTFSGDVQLTLDRMIFHDGSIAVGLAVPRGFGSGRLAILAGARAPVRTTLRPGLMPIPLLAMESNGTLDTGALQMWTTARSGARTTHRVDATLDTLVLTQTY